MSGELRAIGGYFYQGRRPVYARDARIGEKSGEAEQAGSSGDFLGSGFVAVRVSKHWLESVCSK